MERTDLQERTADFGRRFLRLYCRLKKRDDGAAHIGLQLLRAATSIGANYAEAIHGRSGAEFISKLKVCEGEAAESAFWIDQIIHAKYFPKERLSDLHSEALQLVAIFCASANTHKQNHS